MRKEQGKVAVHLLERSQQTLAPFSVQTCDATAQRFDRFFQICLFTKKRIMLDLHILAVFLSAQIHRAQSIALTLQTVHIRFNRPRLWHLIYVDLQCLKQISRACLHFFGNPLGCIGHRAARCICARF